METYNIVRRTEMTVERAIRIVALESETHKAVLSDRCCPHLPTSPPIETYCTAAICGNDFKATNRILFASN